MSVRVATVELADLLIAPVSVTVARADLIGRTGLIGPILAAAAAAAVAVVAVEGMRGRAAAVEPAGLLIAPVLVTVAGIGLVGSLPVAAVAG